MKDIHITTIMACALTLCACGDSKQKEQEHAELETLRAELRDIKQAEQERAAREAQERAELEAIKQAEQERAAREAQERAAREQQKREEEEKERNTPLHAKINKETGMSIDNIIEQLEKYASVGKTEIETNSYTGSVATYTIGEYLLQHYNLMKDGVETITDAGYLPNVLQCAYQNGPRSLPRAKYVKTLLSAGAKPNQWFVGNWSALHFACANNDIECCKILLDAGANPNLIRADGAESSLYVAAARGAVECCKLLLEQGANPNLKVIDNFDKNTTPLNAAAEFGSEGCCRLLLEHGADVNAKNDSGYAPLHRAAYNSIACSKLLLEHGADVNIKNEQGETPLHYVLRMARMSDNITDSCKLLLEHGADPNAKDSNGTTPMDYYSRPKGMLESFGGKQKK